MDEQKENLTKIEINQYNKDPINLTFRNVTYKVLNKNKKEDKIILNNVSGAFYYGRLTAILGPSGAGKTSLLKILAGSRKKKYTGKIYVNDHARDLNQFQWQSSFIAQEASLIQTLTVEETLHVAAELKLSRSTTKNEKLDIITDITTLLGLKNSMDTRISNLSGGEIKRLSIGVELITNPSIMFFDEPTSGLDSVSSCQVISHLRTLAVKGHTIICVIHQPSSQLFNMFDDLMIMSRGRCIYNGSLNNMVDTFETAGFKCPQYYNRADFALDIASGGMSGDIESLIVKNSCSIDDCSSSSHAEEISNNNETIGKNRGKFAVSQLKQFSVLLNRSMKVAFRDVQLAYMRVAAHLLVGIILGLIYYDIGNDAAKIDSNASLLFFLIMFIFFSTAMPTVLTFPQEAAVFEREHQNNWYSVSSYFFSKLLADFPLQILCPTIFIISSYYLTNQPTDCFRMIMVWAVCIVFSAIAQMIGLVMGVLFSVQMGIFSVPATTIPMLIFSGFFLKFDEISAYFKPFSYLSHFGYGFEALLLAIYDYNRKTLDCSGEFCYMRSPTKFLRHMNAKLGNYYNDLAILIGFVVVLQIALFIALKFRIWRSDR